MKKLYIFSLLLFLSTLPSNCLATNSSDVVINEIAWMGTTTSANDEWIELFNNTQNAINLEIWVLKSDDGTPEIKLTGAIPANGFFLLERTDDNTVLEIPADQIYKGALGNSGEDLKLYNNSGNLVDEANFSSGWPAGDNPTKQTMEKTSAGWQTSQNPGGTPKAQNSTGAIVKIEPTPTKEETAKTPTEEKPAENSSLLAENYPDGIVFSEILPSPEGADETEEWIELYNQNNFEVDLSGWQIKDAQGKITTYAFPNGTKISPNGYLVLKRPETNITLNNDNDSLNLFWPNEKIIDSVSFEKAPLGQSYNRTSAGWKWAASPSPGSVNILPEVKNLPAGIKEEPEVANAADLISEKGLAAIEIPTKNKIPSKSLIIALGVALVSGIIIFILKKSLTKSSS